MTSCHYREESKLDRESSERNEGTTAVCGEKGHDVGTVRVPYLPYMYHMLELLPYITEFPLIL